MHTYRQTGRQRQIEAASNIQRHKDTYRHMQMQIQAGWRTIIQAYIHTGNKSCRQAGRAPIHTDIQPDIQAGIQAIRHRNIQPHRHAGIHTHIQPYIQVIHTNIHKHT